MNPDYDLIVIGGGVNGTGIARDAAMRGIKVLLVEKEDFSYGATGACSGMIHGGLRYLLNDVRTTKKSCVDSGYIQSIAPHLLFRIPLLTIIPHKLIAEPMETYFEVYDRFVKYKRGKPHTRLTAAEACELEPGLIPNNPGAITTDEYGIDTFRLTISNALSAAYAGAKVLNHCEVTALLRGEGGKVLGARIRDKLTGESGEVGARIVMNAGGPWGPLVAKLADASVKIRPAKGVHLTLDRRISNMGIVTSAVDNRSIFVIPHENTSIIGTTDDDYYGDPDDIPISEDEVEYLLQGIAKVFPAVRHARILRAWAGVRPTLFKWGPNEDALSRDHKVIDHSSEGAPGLMSITGGKLAAYRIMSEDAVDQVAKQLGVTAPCRTHLEPLPGGDFIPDATELAREYSIPIAAARRLVYRQGSRSLNALGLLKENPAWRRLLCRCEQVLEAEARFAIRNELVSDLNDLRRRTRIGMGPCQGGRCAARAAIILAEEKGESPETALAYLEGFLQRRFKGEAPSLMGSQLTQVEISQAIHQCLGRLQEYVEGSRCR